MTPTITTSPLISPVHLVPIHSVPVQCTQCIYALAYMYMYTGLSVYFSVSKSVSLDTYFVSTLSVQCSYN